MPINEFVMILLDKEFVKSTESDTSFIQINNYKGKDINCIVELDKYPLIQCRVEIQGTKISTKAEFTEAEYEKSLKINIDALSLAFNNIINEADMI